MKIPRGAAVVLRSGKILVIKRYLQQESAADCAMCEYTDTPGPECSGHRYAVLPGGHVEPGESAAAAALRELTEETTLTGAIDHLLWTGTHNGRPAYYFQIKDVAGVPELSGDEAAVHSGYGPCSSTGPACARRWCDWSRYLRRPCCGGGCPAA
ncbi:ADP-ribose pyrophosphatase YjhB (NUDIX family) [Kribbella aluminosa]|uniref:ADP-ribose pyrophosphatase YjhB (NUDIX family) n=1 Tax=Kribbella aluminosa TaxID=416017 RepID=A0ABS4UMP1_9ACTN|nr:NUDIX domain-containing protein [Kribbella aluminosa]MBP2352895.1 ADP-ribose pyrophosphatase YjhB (NUDIX family) [Kribbella aluminosa]